LLQSAEDLDAGTIMNDLLNTVGPCTNADGQSVF